MEAAGERETPGWAERGEIRGNERANNNKIGVSLRSLVLHAPQQKTLSGGHLRADSHE